MSHGAEGGEVRGELTELAALMAQRPGVEIETARDRFMAYVSQRPAWMAEAACRGVGAEVFYIERGGDVRPAKQLCSACPVIDPCREYALEDPANMFGIWAGQSVSRLRKSSYRAA